MAAGPAASHAVTAAWFGVIAQAADPQVPKGLPAVLIGGPKPWRAAKTPDLDLRSPPWMDHRRSGDGSKWELTSMLVKRFSDAKPYGAANHRACKTLRLFGADAGRSQNLIIGVTHFVREVAPVRMHR
jgi:hypothetical protein